MPVALARGSNASLIVRVSGMPCGRSATTRNAVGRQLPGQVSSERLFGGHRRAVTADEREAGSRMQCGHGHDHPRLVRNHAPCGKARGQEVRLGICRDRPGELPELQIDQRHTQNAGVRNADRIERDIDAPNPVDHRLQMRIDGLLVQGIDLRGHRGSARRNNVLGQRIDGRPIATGEEKRDPLICEGTRDGATDAARGAVHNGDLVLQHGDTDTAMSAKRTSTKRPFQRQAGVYT
jgi:hypothetical protein